MARCRTYRYLLQPTARQRVSLESLLRSQCELYNAALEERRGAWRWEHRSVSYFDQTKTLSALRGIRPETLGSDPLAFGVTVCRGTLKRLDLAFRAFHRRCSRGETPGYPRFRSSHRCDSVQYEDRSGWRLKPDTRRLALLGIGHIRCNLHRPWKGTPKAITVARQGRRWWVSVRCVDVPQEILPETGRQVGIDLGVCALVATSDGGLVTEGRKGRHTAARLARVQAELARK